MTNNYSRLISILEEKKIGNGVLIYSHTMTPACRKVRSPLSLPKLLFTPLLQVIVQMAHLYRLQEFAESDLLVNITHHKLVPRHEILSPDEKKMLLER